MVVGVAVWMLNRARNQDDVVYRTELKPGERLLVDHPSPEALRPATDAWGADEDRSILQAGERILLVDAKERRYLITLRPGPPSTPTWASSTTTPRSGPRRDRPSSAAPAGGSWWSGPPSPTRCSRCRGARRSSTPRTSGAILIEADIAPGVRVLEAGVGSGALSMALLRAGADVVGYELREDFADRARANVAAMVGADAPYRVEIRDVYDGIDEQGLDRILLDLPEPWRVLPHAAVALRPGGILCAYLPTINQTSQLRRPWSTAASGWPRRSRCCTGPGTSRTARSAPTTAWSATPGSSPRPGCCPLREEAVRAAPAVRGRVRATDREEDDGLGPGDRPEG